jgi:hypothetical protein
VTAVEEWAAEHVAILAGSVVTKEEARASFVMWCSEHGVRPGPGTGMSKAIVAAGGRAKQKPTRWEGVTVLEPTDSGYRSKTRPRPEPPERLPAHVTLAALTALRDAGLITDRDALNHAYRELR